MMDGITRVCLLETTMVRAASFMVIIVAAGSRVLAHEPAYSYGRLFDVSQWPVLLFGLLVTYIAPTTFTETRVGAA